MARYRKKPVEIEAKQVPRYSLGISTLRYVDRCIALAEWCGGISHMMNENEHDNHILIPTLEGDMKALPGDYIIKGIQGEFYPCKPDIFEATYEEM